MAISAAITGAIAGIFYFILVVPPQENDKLAVTNELRLALDWIQDDLVQTPQDLGYMKIPDPLVDQSYGTFAWYGDYSVEIKYRYDNGKLLREESIDGDTTTLSIAFDIAEYGDFDFDYDDESKMLMANMTVTRNPGADDEISVTAIRNIGIRANTFDGILYDGNDDGDFDDPEDITTLDPIEILWESMVRPDTRGGIYVDDTYVWTGCHKDGLWRAVRIDGSDDGAVTEDDS
ncbi:unnamed protein product, partial [marine sediment metagenome]